MQFAINQQYFSLPLFLHNLMNFRISRLMRSKTGLFWKKVPSMFEKSWYLFFNVQNCIFAPLNIDMYQKHFSHTTFQQENALFREYFHYFPFLFSGFLYSRSASSYRWKLRPVRVKVHLKKKYHFHPFIFLSLSLRLISGRSISRVS